MVTHRRLAPIFALCLLLALPGLARADAIQDMRDAVTAQQGGHLDEAIRLYDRAIAARQLSPHNLAKAYGNRCNAFNERLMTDQAIADCDEAIRLDPQASYAFLDRGNADLRRGAYDRAIADYTSGIGFGADAAAAYNNRGYAYLHERRFAAAIADFTAALRRQPNFARAYANRGYAELDTGAPAAGADDLAAAVRLAPDGYELLWLALARHQAHQSDRGEVARAARRIDLARWPGPIVAFYLGHGSAERVREAAAEAGDAAHETREPCEADFFIGAYQLEKGQTAAANENFQTVLDSCPRESLEWRAAALALHPKRP